MLLIAVAAHAAAAPRGAPRRTPSLDVTSDETLPVPPIPPDVTPPYLAAPVPDTDISAPDQPFAKPGAQLKPGFYSPKDYNVGEGYMPGSTIQGEQEHRAKPMPSLNLKLPLQ
jgi:hypothetical protein